MKERFSNTPFLEQAQFLTSFQSYFLGKNESLPPFAAAEQQQAEEEGRKSFHGPVTPNEVAAVYEYRALKERARKLEEDVFLFEFHNRNQNQNTIHKNDDDVDLLQIIQSKDDKKNKRNVFLEPLRDCQRQLAEQVEQNPRLEALDVLVERFEVWCTKALAQQFLLSHSHKRSAESDAKCWSMLLNIPSASYSATIFPSAVRPETNENKNDNYHEIENSSPFAMFWDELYNKFNNNKNNENKDTIDLCDEPEETVNNNRSSSNTTGKHNNNNNETPVPPHMCSLLLPPCIDTWKEYLRLSHMVSLLPNATAVAAAHSSLLTGDAKMNKETTLTKFLFQPHDLVALWVRAQRSSQAKRHLLSLFRVTKENIVERKNDDQLDNQQQQKSNNPIDRGDNVVNKKKWNYIATFLGNHEKTKRRVIHETPLIDRLREWAIANQVLYTWPVVLDGWKRAERKKLRLYFLDDDNENRNNNYFDATPLPSSSEFEPRQKKIRPTNRDEELTKPELDHLKRSCQAHILRLFARRNTKVVSALSYKDETELNAAKRSGIVVDEFTEKLVRRKVMDHIRNMDHFRDKLATDYKLPRMDRRVRLGLYDKSGKDRFYESVLTLLEALRESAVKVAVLKENDGEDGRYIRMFQEAIQDFKFLALDGFLKTANEFGIVAAAMSLLDPARAADIPLKDIPDVLLERPGPWCDRCSKCDQALLTEDSKFQLCNSCDSPFHSHCCSDKSNFHNCMSFVKSYEPLKQMYKVQVPSGIDPPDFRSSRSTNDDSGDSAETAKSGWSMKALDCERTLDDNGHLPRYGMDLKDSERCANELDQILSGSFLVSDLKSKDAFPVAYSSDHVGLVVTGVTPGGIANKFGIEVGDVIIAFKILEFHTDNPEPKYHPAVTYTFAKRSPSERIDLLLLPVIKARLVVARPGGGIADRIRTFTKKVQEEHQALLDSLESSQTFWYCEKCVVRGKDLSVDECVDHVTREASACKALIRRLEADADENTNKLLNEDYVSVEKILECEDEDSVEQSIEKLHASCVSLQRLEAMMDVIIQANSTNSGKEEETNRAAFFVGSRRLTWAPKELESNPFELLCRGMSLIARRSNDGCCSIRRDFLGRFLAQFLRLFCSWCLGSTLSSQLQFATFGVPQFAMTITYPSTTEINCHRCLVRSRTNNVPYGSCIACYTLCEDPRFSPRIDHFIRCYEEYASYVGSIVLLLPGQPLLEKTASLLKDIGLFVEHFDRPLEFLVASYLPPRSASGLHHGIFHLIPLLSQQQLEFLLTKCKMRKPRKELSETLDHWKVDGLIDLVGVAQINFNELYKLVEQTRKIEDAISTMVAGLAETKWYSPDEPETHLSKPKSLGPDDTIITTCDSWNAAAFEAEDAAELRALAIVESMVDSGTALMRKILNSVKSETSAVVELNEIENMECETAVQPLVLNTGRVDGEDRRFRLLFTDMEDTKDDGSSIFLENVSPDSEASNEVTIDIILDNVNNLEKGRIMPSVNYSFAGWGFELFCCKENGNQLKVGRIRKYSVAEACGLKERDVVLSINGQDAQEFIRNPGLLVNALFSLPMEQSCRSLKEAREMLCRRQETGVRSVGPLILRVSRVALQMKNGLSATIDPLKEIQAGVGSAHDSCQVRPECTPILAGNFGGSVDQAGDNLAFWSTVQQIPGETSQNPVNEAYDWTLRATTALAQNYRDGQNERTTAASAETTERNPVTEHFTRSESPIEVWTNPAPKQGQGRVVLQIAQPIIPQIAQPIIPQIAQPIIPSPTLQTLAGARPSVNALVLPQNSTKNPQTHHATSQAKRQNLFENLSPPYTRQSIGQPLKYIESALNLSSTRRKSNVARRSDLYERGLEKSILSRLETSLLLQCISSGWPMLGVRMLLPRYDIKMIFREFFIIGNHGLIVSIPFIDEVTFKNILSLDYERSKGEHGDVAIIDSPEHCYKMPSARFPIDRLIEQIFNTNGSFNYDASLNAVIGFDIQRLRGGGSTTSEEVEHKTLKHIDRMSWNGTLVYMFGEAKRGNGDLFEAKFIGVVDYNFSSNGQSDSVRNSEAGESVPVNVFYIDTKGIVAPTKKIEEDPDFLFVAEPGSDEEKWFNRWNEVRKGENEKNRDPGNNALQPILEIPPVSEESVLTDIVCPVVDQETEVCPEPNSTIEMIDACRHFAREMIDGSINSGSLLGYLPSGQTLHWFPCDPKAVYLSVSVEIDKGLRTLQTSGHQHVPNEFTLRGISKLPTSKCNSFRLEEGDQVLQLLSFLANEACTQCPALVDLCVKSPVDDKSGVICFDFLLFLNRQACNILTTARCTTSVLKLVSLSWSMIRLFDEQGRFRFPDEFHSFFPESISLQTRFLGHVQSTNCLTCDLGKEHVLVTNDSARAGFQGIGCSSMLDIFFGEEKAYTSISHLKRSILRISDRVPQALRRKNNSFEISWGNLWAGSHVEVWRGLVKGSRQAQTLAQAFIVLLSSLNHSLLPVWWRNYGSGWTVGHTLTSSTSESALFLHIKLLDAAIAEFSSASISAAPHLPLHQYFKEESSYRKMIAQTLKWSQDLGWKRCDEDEEYCFVCEDGGDLLCCELCSNVCHFDCLRPKLDHPSDDFICLSCIQDVAHLKNKRFNLNL